MPRLKALLFGVLLLTGAAHAQQATYFHGTDVAGAEYFLAVRFMGHDTASLHLLQAPARPGNGTALEMAAEGRASLAEGTWNIALAEGHLELDSGNSRSEEDLNPLGSGTMALDNGSVISLSGIGTEFSGSITAPDSTFIVGVDLPFFYQEPWVGQLLFGGLNLGLTWEEGLEHRSMGATEPWSVYTMEETVIVTALSGSLISALKVTFWFTGGAHPNTYRETQTLLLADSGIWQEAANLCTAPVQLGWDCDEAHVRDLVIADLLEQEAEWVVAGEVDAAATWLLDRFTLGSNQLTVIFDPYDVGPYVQGAFLVGIPYSELAD